MSEKEQNPPIFVPIAPKLNQHGLNSRLLWLQDIKSGGSNMINLFTSRDYNRHVSYGEYIRNDTSSRQLDQHSCNRAETIFWYLEGQATEYGTKNFFIGETKSIWYESPVVLRKNMMMGASMDGYNLNFSKMPLFWRSMIFKCWQGDVRFAYLGAVRVSYKHVDQRLWHRQSGGWRGCKKSWGLSQLKVLFTAEHLLSWPSLVH